MRTMKTTMHGICFRFSLIATLFSLLLSLSAVSVTHVVKQDGSGDFTLIQAAIESANSGDTILVYPGVYVENVNFMGKGLTVNSLEALSGDRSYVHNTVIDGNRANPCVTFFRGSLDATLRGFTLRNGMGSFRFDNEEIESWGGGIFMIQTGRVNLINCDVTDNVASIGAGIYSSSSRLYLSGVKIYENRAACGVAGLHISGDNQQVTSILFDPDNLCSIYSNYGRSPVDICFADLRANVEINLDLATVAQPTEFYIGRIVNFPELDYYTETINIQRGLRTEVNHDLYVSPDGDDTNSGLSPSQPMKTITKALHRIKADSLDIKTVHVLPGIYDEADGQIFPLPLKNNVNLIGAGSSQTTLIANSDLPPMMRVMISGQDNINITLKGFTLLSANEDLNFPLVMFGRSTNLKVSDIVIRDMKVIRWGAVNIMHWNSSEIDSLVLENISTEEVAFYAMNIESGSISNCRFENINSLHVDDDPFFNGMAMIDIWFSGTLRMDNCEFRNLSVVDDQPTLHVSRKSFYIVDASTEVSITNCLFTGIRTNSFRAMAFFAEDPGTYKVSNCTFFDNYGNWTALATGGHISMRNNIFFNPDVTKEIHIYRVSNPDSYQSELDFDYNLIRGGAANISGDSMLLWGDHNLTQEPAFVSIDPSDPCFLHLSSESPCIDAGTPDISDLDLPPYDLAGNQRVWNEVIDMGCFEYGAPPWVTNDDPVAPEIPGTSISIYPNPFKGNTTISWVLEKGEPVKIEIYNLRGQKVTTLYDGLGKKGRQTVNWDARDAKGQSVGSGVYICHLSTPKENRAQKMVVMK